jgi:hypothetical protein
MWRFVQAVEVLDVARGVEGERRARRRRTCVLNAAKASWISGARRLRRVAILALMGT